MLSTVRQDRFVCTFPVCVTLTYEDEFAKERGEDTFITYWSIMLPLSGFARSMALDQELHLLNYTYVVCCCSS